MRCPYCANETKVIDSREMGDGVRRRRECDGCHARFTTFERVLTGNLFVIKKDGRREEFNRDKLLTGIRKASEKRPLPTGAIDKLASDVEAELYHLGKAEVPSTLVGDLVMARLKELDYIAYVRFASVYHEFADITAMKQVVDSLVEGGGSPPQSQLPLLGQDEIDMLARRGNRQSRLPPREAVSPDGRDSPPAPSQIDKS